MIKVPKIFIVGTACTGITEAYDALCKKTGLTGCGEKYNQKLIEHIVAPSTTTVTTNDNNIISMYRAEEAPIDKTHLNLWIVEMLASAFPDAIFVAMKRNVNTVISQMLRIQSIKDWCIHYTEKQVKFPSPFMGASTAIEYGKLNLKDRCKARVLSHFKEIDRLATVLPQTRFFILDHDDKATFEREINRIASIVVVPVLQPLTTITTTESVAPTMKRLTRVFDAQRKKPNDASKLLPPTPPPTTTSPPLTVPPTATPPPSTPPPKTSPPTTTSLTVTPTTTTVPPITTSTSTPTTTPLTVPSTATQLDVSPTAAIEVTPTMETPTIDIKRVAISNAVTAAINKESSSKKPSSRKTHLPSSIQRKKAMRFARGGGAASDSLVTPIPTVTLPLPSIDYHRVDYSAKIKFYWINLERAPHRKTRMEEGFDKRSISHKRVLAYDGQTFDFRPFIETKIPQAQLQRHKLEIATSLSHLRALHAFVQDGDAIGIICEDDLSFEYESYWRGSLEQMIAEAPSNWQVLQLGLTINVPKEWHNIMTAATTAAPLNGAGAGAYLPRKAHWYSALAYAVKREYAIGILTTHGVCCDKPTFASRFKIVNIEHAQSERIVIGTGPTKYLVYPPVFTYPTKNDSFIHPQHLRMHEASKNLIAKAYCNNRMTTNE